MGWEQSEQGGTGWTCSWLGGQGPAQGGTSGHSKDFSLRVKETHWRVLTRGVQGLDFQFQRITLVKWKLGGRRVKKEVGNELEA